MKFQIEQIAIAPLDPIRAQQLLIDMGAVDWVEDEVNALGAVFDFSDVENTATLRFNYDMGAPKLEFEILTYHKGPQTTNWLEQSVVAQDGHEHRVSHLGMHCTEDELEKWGEFFAERGIGIAQEVRTRSHTNPHIAGKRWYEYVIFDTFNILGVDLKFIVRYSTPQA